MGVVAVSARKIAEQQLLAAIRVWRDGDYISAITLAGAAEEILGKRLRGLGREPSLDNLKSAVVELSRLLGIDDPKAAQHAADSLNRTKNDLKHYAGYEELQFDPLQESIDLIERAIANYRMLTGLLHDDMAQFWVKVADARGNPPLPS